MEFQKVPEAVLLECFCRLSSNVTWISIFYNAEVPYLSIVLIQQEPVEQLERIHCCNHNVVVLSHVTSKWVSPSLFFKGIFFNHIRIYAERYVNSDWTLVEIQNLMFFLHSHWASPHRSRTQPYSYTFASMRFCP